MQQDSRPFLCHWFKELLESHFLYHWFILQVFWPVTHMAQLSNTFSLNIVYYAVNHMDIIACSKVCEPLLLGEKGISVTYSQKPDADTKAYILKYSCSPCLSIAFPTRPTKILCLPKEATHSIRTHVYTHTHKVINRYVDI